ncbi:hypothetical protein KY328_03410 [Candidatus Woesearchaeota archaeon]|nr:hypothetical protein [Candidatus Woesearchaeota archaeon]MBW3021942.1 hypothetical protein [Candidatus Woesearchaeota archaeon]
MESTESAARTGPYRLLMAYMGFRTGYLLGKGVPRGVQNFISPIEITLVLSGFENFVFNPVVCSDNSKNLSWGYNGKKVLSDIIDSAHVTAIGFLAGYYTATTIL